MPSPLSILFCEPYDGGSHREFRLGLTRHSRHEIVSLTLPPRFWKWRMRAAAVHFADAIRNDLEDRPHDLLIATSLLNAADLRGLLPPPLDRAPLLLYMHENQLTYPLSPEEEFDFHFGFTNILSTLAADHVVFNSAFHREAFLAALPDYLARMPDAIPRNIRGRIASRSSVLPVGLERTPLPADAFAAWRGSPCPPETGPPWPRDGRPLVLWNHRWEFDKEPDVFARALTTLAGRGVDFGVVLLGEPRQNDDLPRRLAADLGDRCLHVGWEGDPTAYAGWLARADVVVSCAQQEYFGISVAEAVHAGAYPVLPRRQVYPSLYGRRCRGRHLYDDEAGLIALLADVLQGRCGHVCSLQNDIDVCCWPRLIGSFDDLFARVAAGETAGP